MFSDAIAIFLQVLFILNIIFAVFIFLFERRNPAVTWVWIIIALLIPYIGFFLYLLIGLEGRKHGVFSRKARQDEKFFSDYAENLNSEKTAIAKTRPSFFDNNHINNMVHLNYSLNQSLMTSDNEVDIFYDGNEKFDTLIKDIEKAKKFIHLQYYIVKNGYLSKKLVAALTKKAKEGVEVRFMFDGMGCARTSKKLFKPLEDAGGKIGIFLPPYFIRINYRNHRKICVIDGEIAYVGGFNIGDEYLGLVKRFGNWHDCHIRITGSAVCELNLRFVTDWNHCSKETVPLERKYFPSNPETYDKNDGVKIQIVSSGPDTARPNVHSSFLKMITKAEKSIYIQSPYFVPDDALLEMLRIAALSGVDVRIMIPANPDHPFVYWAALSYMSELLDAGVKCYQYENGFVHSKILIVDGFLATVGTTNMDIRSFKLNFETNAFIYDKETAFKLEQQFLKDIEYCTVIDMEFYKKRRNRARIREAIARLISPLL
ncbi:MAG: cardiolipin synthase [Defluviitaleaceae bacterium]|nr:cardiolipin synthase [Defluviitaleaceae bacterium]